MSPAPRYDPASRGPYPVGVVTEAVENLERGGATFSVEVWYPALGAVDVVDTVEIPGVGPTRCQAVRGAAVARGRHPLCMLSHGFMGHRRQLAYLATHVASHGYVVACPDHEHLTRQDVTLLALGASMRGERYDLEDSLRRVIWQHPTELREMVRALVEGEIVTVMGSVDLDRLAVGGFDLGGWIAMKATERLAAAALVLLAPAGGQETGLGASLHGEHVEPAEGASTLAIAGGGDAVVPPSAVEHLLGRLAGPTRSFTLADCGHMQLTDEGDAGQRWLATDAQAKTLVPTAEAPRAPDGLRPAAEHQRRVQSLVTAHLDATLSASAAAQDWLVRFRAG